MSKVSILQYTSVYMLRMYFYLLVFRFITSFSIFAQFLETFLSFRRACLLTDFSYRDFQEKNIFSICSIGFHWPTVYLRIRPNDVFISCSCCCSTAVQHGCTFFRTRNQGIVYLCDRSRFCCTYCLTWCWPRGLTQRCVSYLVAQKNMWEDVKSNPTLQD